MGKLLLIDGHSILSRAFYGIPMLTTSGGIHTNAVYGFLNIMLKSIEDESALRVMAAFDMDRHKLKRTAMYPDYKGNRKPMPAELLEQVPIVQRVLAAMGIPLLTLEGYEADDLLGTVARKAAASGYEVTILSGDRDLLQLSDPHIKISVPKTSRGRTEVFNYFPEDVKKEYQVTPEEFIDLKALMGDSSDNIPGLPGVGQKTATDIIVKYGSIENAKAHAAEVRPPRARKALEEHYDLAVLSKELATIDTDAPVEVELGESGAGSADGIYTAAALDILRELELKSLVSRFAKHMDGTGNGDGAGSAARAIDTAGARLVRDRFLAGVAMKDAVYEELIGVSLFCRGGGAAWMYGDEGDMAAGGAAGTDSAAGAGAAAGVGGSVGVNGVSGADSAAGTGDAVRKGGPEAAVVGLVLSDKRSYCILSGGEYPAGELVGDLKSMLRKRIAQGRPVALLGLKGLLKYLDIEKNSLLFDAEIAQYVTDPNRGSYGYDDLAKGFLGVAVRGEKELLGKHDLFEMLHMITCEQLSIFGAGDALSGSGKTPGAGRKSRKTLTAGPGNVTGACGKVRPEDGGQEPGAGPENKDTGSDCGPYSTAAGTGGAHAYSGRASGTEDAGLAAAKEYVVLGAMVPYLTYDKLVKRMEADGTRRLFEEIELPLVYALDDMEKAGIAVDRESLDSYAVYLKAGADKLTEEIYRLSGEEFNINSPQQLGHILFEKLGIKGGRKTRTGYSTAADVLEKLAPEHEIVAKVLRYRALTKLYSTYAAGLTEFISADGRIHGTFNQTITATGRISSTDPNLQNIPVRTEEGREIRKVFVPREGFVFVDADYSQIELRVLAALSGDSEMIAAYADGTDVHALTASQVFHTPLEEVTPEMRRKAKAVNFGIVYGISAFGLGEGLDISRKEASEYIDRYFAGHPGVDEYLKRCVKEARELGYSRTYFGRIRQIPELKSSNYMQRSFGERIAMNSPIQGTAADIMKIAMNRVNDALKGMRSRIVLQVHDELLIETAPEELEDVRAIVKDCMENAADLAVRLEVNVESGGSWYECH